MTKPAAGAFLVPGAKADKAENRFVFRIPGEKQDRSMPLLKHIKASYRRRLSEVSRRLKDENLSEDARALARLEAESIQFETIEDCCPGLTDVVSSDQLEAIITAWGEASGTTVGESSAS